METPAHRNGLRNFILGTQRHMTLLIIIDMIVAMLFSVYWRDPVLFLKRYALAASFLMILPIMINTEFAEIFEAGSKYKLISISLVSHFILSPLLLFVILKLLVHVPEIAAGLLFIAIMPTSGMAAVWTKLVKGAVSTTIVILSTSLLLGVLLIPFETHFIVGRFISVPMGTLIRSVLILLVLPLILGWLIRRVVIKQRGEQGFIKAKPFIHVFSTLGLLIIIFIAFGLKGNVLLKKPDLALVIALPMLLYYAFGFTFLTWLGRRLRFSPADTVALSYGTMTKNRSMATAIAIAIFSPMTVTAIALAGVIAQLPAMLLYERYARKLVERGASELMNSE